MLKTWPKGNGTLYDALRSLKNKPNTITDIKKHKKYASAKPLAFKSGGIADFTGPAWLDGTKSKPELVLNAKDTANFIALKDNLATLMNKGTTTTQSTGDLNFDIDINVEKIDNDYDVKKVAAAVKKEIVSSANYRNVNVVRNLM